MSILGTPSLRSCLLFCLVAASPAALADRIRIHGPQTALSSGSSFTFRATREEAAPVERKGPPRAGAGRWLWKVLAEGDPGLMIEDTGEYFAPRVTAERLVQVLVFDRDDDRIQESLTVLIAPAGKAAPAGDRGDSKGAGHGGAGAGGSLVLQRAEGASVPGLHGGIPLPTGPAPARKGAAPADPRAWADTTLLAGYGVPFQVPLPPLPAPGWNLRFLVQAGDRWQPLDATSGLKPIVLRGRVGRCRLEAASPGLGLLSSQEVRRQELTVDLRGMTLLAGTPADRGHRDGVGQEARFEEVFGLATVRTRTGTSCLVADSRTHVVRRIDPGGQVATLWGKPYAHGHREGRDSEARFCHPTYLLAPSAPLPGKRAPLAVVADTGNHALKLIHADGEVELLAGQPGQKGHVDDGGPVDVRFNRPMGLAQDPAGNLYVADAGNQVIRVMTREGEWTTLAGRSGIAGTQDGTGEAARFSRLGGLAFDPREQVLYVADGHAIRRVSVPGRVVATVVGDPAARGFQDVLQEGPEARAKALGGPCLAHPGGLQWDPAAGLFIADFGNHAVRLWNPAERTLRTVAGDPGLDATREGLLRDGMEVPLGPAYAGVAGPRALALDRDAAGLALFVASRHAVAELNLKDELRDRLGPLTLLAPEIQGEHYLVQCVAPTVAPDGLASRRHLIYTVECLGDDGLPLAQAVGRGASTGVFEARLPLKALSQGGLVVVRCVTDQGVSAGARQVVQLP